MKTLVLIAACVCATSVASAFEVTWNGRPVAVHPARVSADPLNQVWPGYQRPIDLWSREFFTTLVEKMPWRN